MHAFLLAAAAFAAAPAAPTQEQPAQLRFGDFRAERPGLHAPGFAAIDREGRLWVGETTAGRVRTFAPDGAEVARFALEALPGLPREPWGIAISPDGQVFVADAVEHCVLVLDGSGAQKRKIGRRGSGLGEMREPRGLAIAGDALYVADAGNHRVLVFALDGTFQRAVGRRGFGDGELLAPNDVAVGADGTLFVADLGNQRVARFDPRGVFVRAWGGLGPYSGLFHAPTGIATHAGLVLVADRDNHRVQVFDADGRPHHEWGLHAIRPRDGAGRLHYPSDVAVAPDGKFVAVVEGLEGRAQIFGDEGDAAGDPPIVDRSTAAHYEGGVDAARNLCAVLEPSGSSISIFDMAQPTPVEITRFGRSGSAAGKLLAPSDVEFDADGRSLWVADPLLGRLSQFAVPYEPGGILKFDPFLARFVRALALAELSGVPPAPWPPEPAAIELAPDGRWLVADRANGRVLVLTRELAFERTIGEPGTGPGRLLDPTGLAASSDGRVFVADGRGRKVEVFALRADGAAHAGTIALADAAPGGARPRGLALADAGGLWVTIEDAHALVRLDAEGRATSVFAAPGGRDGLGRREWFHPHGVARLSDGGLAVIDAGNHRFQVLGADGAYRTAWGSRLFLEPLLGTKGAR